MNPFQKIFRLAIAVLAIMVLTAGMAAAAVVTAGTASGNVGTPVSIPITIDNPAGVGGIAFTIAYDPALFAFTGLEQAAPGQTIKDPETFKAADPVLEGVQYYNPYSKAAPYADRIYTTMGNATLFYQFNDIKNAQNQPVGRVMVSGASAVSLTGTVLFNAKFTINGGVNGTLYPVRLQRSIINNPAAGYAIDTFLPVLVGTSQPNQEGKYDSLIFPVIAATLVDGAITVNTPVFSLGGKVTYETGGTNAVGCTVTLKKETVAGSGIYLYNDQTAVGATGLYNFTGKAAGKYKLSVNSLDPNHNGFDSTTPIEIVNANITNADVVLTAKPQPVRLSGTVTQGNIPGLLVKVVNGTAFDSPLMGIYSIDPTAGTWSSALLPNGGNYHYYLVYGSLNSGADVATFDTSVLKTISGTIAGLPAGGGAVTAISTLGKITKTLQVTNGAYTIDNLVAANDYIVSAVATGLPLTYYNGKTDVNEATPVDISSAPAVGINFNFVPPASVITGTITDTGAGVNGITVYGFEVNTFALISTATNASGAYSLSVPQGSYEVFVIKSNGKIFYFYNENGTPTQNESSAVLRTVATNGQTVVNTNIDLTECDKTLTGKVTYRTANGDVAPNVLIAAFNPTKRALGLTGQDGRYTIGGLCAEAYSVEMKPLTGNYPVQTASTVFTGTDTTKTKDFIIDTGSVLSGTVSELASNPVKTVSGAMLYLKDQTTGSLVGGRIYFSAQDGTYSIRDIQSGSYTLEVTHPDYRGYTTDLLIDIDKTQDVALEKGAYFKGTITESNSNPVKNLAGATVIVTRVGATPVYTVTNSAGFYSVYGLDAGQNYIIIAQRRGYERQAKGVAPTLSPTTAGTVVDFALAPPAATYTVSGTVKTDAVPPATPEISDAIVLVSSAKKNFFASTITNTSGGYTVSNLAASDDYRIVVIPPGLPTQESGAFTVGANVIKDFTIPLGKNIGGTITGSVVAIPSTTKIYVFLYQGTAYKGFLVAGTNGSFLFKGLPDGVDYKLFAIAKEYTPRWYIDKANIGAADPIDITGGSKLDANIQLIKP